MFHLEAAIKFREAGDVDRVEVVAVGDGLGMFLEVGDKTKVLASVVLEDEGDGRRTRRVVKRRRLEARQDGRLAEGLHEDDDQEDVSVR